MATDIDTLHVLDRYDQELRGGASEARRDLILAILERWEKGEGHRSHAAIEESGARSS